MGLVDVSTCQPICFADSYLHWITRAEGSHGWFGLDAQLELISPNQTESRSFVFLAIVPAGRMYVQDGPLLKHPPIVSSFWLDSLSIRSFVERLIFKAILCLKIEVN
jgi:hypothetical protein